MNRRKEGPGRSKLSLGWLRPGVEKAGRREHLSPGNISGSAHLGGRWGWGASTLGFPEAQWRGYLDLGYWEGKWGIKSKFLCNQADNVSCAGILAYIELVAHEIIIWKMQFWSSLDSKTLWPIIPHESCISLKISHFSKTTYNLPGDGWGFPDQPSVPFLIMTLMSKFWGRWNGRIED